VDLAVDATENRVYVAVRGNGNQPCPALNQAEAWPGCIVVLANNGDTNAPSLISSIALVGRPGDMRLDADRGLLYVVLPDQRAIGLVDVRGSKLVGMIDNLPQITSLALDPWRRVLYAAHLTGQLTIIDTNAQS